MMTQISTIEGNISIGLYPDKKGQEAVTLTSSRPVQASSILMGKTPSQALSIVPLVFSLCGVAQSRAALSAIQSHLRIEPDPDLQRAHSLLVLVENAREHLLRIALDWPELFNLERGKPQLSYVAQLLAEFKVKLFMRSDAFSLDSCLSRDFGSVQSSIEQLNQYLQDEVFSLHTANWLEQSEVNDLVEWIQSTESTAAQGIKTICDEGWATLAMTECKSLPDFNAAALLAHLDDNANEFLAAPEWQGRCYETSPLTRQLDHPLIQTLLRELGDSCLLTRYVARLVELAKIPQQLRDLLEGGSASTKGIGSKLGHGLAQVEAARGRLVHRVDINDEGIIDRYQILAPTEWNFHPRGLVPAGLANLKGRDEAELNRLARIFISAVDPCVDYSLRIH